MAKLKDMFDFPTLKDFDNLSKCLVHVFTFNCEILQMSVYKNSFACDTKIKVYKFLL